MNPVLMKIFGVPIYSYGFMLAVGFVVCVLLMLHRAKDFNLKPEQILDLCLYVIISGIIGARVLYVLWNWNYYLENPLEIFLLNKGGLIFYGGFFFAAITAFLFIKKRNLSIGDVSSMLVLYLPLGHAFGRIGCFMNGCCYGRPTTAFFGVQFPASSMAEQVFGLGHIVHPTQIYSALANVIIFLLLAYFIEKGRTFKWQIVLLYMFFYGVSRLIIEFFRADNPNVVWGLNLPQLISIVMILIGSTFYLKCMNQAKKNI